MVIKNLANLSQNASNGQESVLIKVIPKITRTVMNVTNTKRKKESSRMRSRCKRIVENSRQFWMSEISQNYAEERKKLIK
jgi:hypothetical protein